MKEKKGISLIVLIVTIIVMIIIAGAVIISLSQTDIIDKAEDAVTKYNQGVNKEKGTLQRYDEMFNVEAKVIKEKQGNYIIANDVNLEEHDLEIKLTSETLTDFSSVKVSRYGSNLLDVTKMLNSNLVENNDGTYNFNFTGSQRSEYYDIFIPAGVPIMATINTIENTLTKHFKLEIVFEDDSKDYITLYGGTTWQGYKRCITYEKNIKKVAFILVYGAQSGEYIKFSEPKLNIGYIQPYEQYKEVKTITVNSNGIVKDLKSIYPNMTIITNNSEVNINCKYYLPDVEYNLYGKTVVNFGDSIFGNYVFPEDISTYLAKHTNATVYNVGFGGCRMALHSSPEYDAFSMYRLAQSVVDNNWVLQDTAVSSISNINFKEKLQLLKSIDFSKVDIVTISYASNDFTGQISEQQFKDALKSSIEKLTNAYPNLDIVLCTPIYRYWMDENGEFLYDSNTYIKAGNMLTDFAQWIKEVANEYNLFVIDNYNNCGINNENRTQYFSAGDGTHPNKEGRKLIAENMAKELYNKFK